MHKKYALLVIALGILVVNNVVAEDNTAKKSEYIFDSFDKNLPAELANLIPKEQRDDAQRKYEEKEKNKKREERLLFFDRILIEELEQPGVIKNKLLQKIKDINEGNEKDKKKVCTCNRGKGTFWDDATETQVKNHDLRLDNNAQWNIQQYTSDADLLKKRVELVRAATNKAAIEYQKSNDDILLKTFNSLTKCGLNVACNKGNGIFPDHLTQEYRQSLSTKIFEDSVVVCADKIDEAIVATKQELEEVWQKYSALQPHLQTMKKYNEEIDYLINPDNQEEIEKKKKEQKELADLAEKQKQEELLRQRQQK